MRKAFGTMLLLVSATFAQAQTGKAPWEEFGNRLTASEKVAPLGNNAFGDEVSLSNGALSFSATDVSIPGNSGLPVAVGRSYSVRDRRYYLSDSMFADWDIQLPHVSGVFASDWLVGSGNTNRCLDSAAPPLPGAGTLLSDFWTGTHLNIPGVGGGEMLIADAGITKPGLTGNWLWIAGNQIHISCLTTIKNGTGEGFLAITPDGTRYWFDWMAQTFEPTLRRGSVRGVNGEPLQQNIARRKNILYATRVEDRFGNWVTYTYTNAWSAPGRLTAINSNDSRQLTLTYNTNGHVATVSDGTRTWTYTYGTTTSGRRTLTRVTLPDTSTWEINFTAFTNAEIQYTEVFTPGEIYRNCRMLEIPLNYASEPVGTISHPAGAVGTFTVNIKEHGRSSVPLNCGNVSTSPIGSPPGTNNDVNDDVNLWPISYHGWTLKTKQVSGAGLTTAAWNYAYTAGKSIHLYPGVTLQNPVCSPFSTCIQPPCTSDACAGASTTTVTGPNNEWTRYTYGNTYLYDEGKLKKVESGSTTVNDLRVTTNTFDLSQAPQIYPAKYGKSRQVNRGGFQEEYHRPQLSSSIAQQAETFTWQATQFDYYARPTREVRSSTLGHSRTDETAYHDNTAKWVIGQVAHTRNVNLGVYTSRTDYDGTTAVPVRFHTPGTTLSNGIAVQTLTYNSDGTIATAMDGNNRITTLSNWYRGVPRTVQFPGGVSQLAQVSAPGFITEVTDENGFTTTYGYDAMGRRTSLTHPTDTPVAWTGTTIAYAKVASTEYGIPSGHWRQTVTRGNYRKVTYFDALWRPVIEREYDNAAATATQRFSGWKYDHEGRVAFVGYPRSTATSISSFATGTTTSYDVLGRPSSVSQSTELGSPAITLYSYLPDFVTRVRNPRLFNTDTTFQAFDRPDTSAPKQIVAAVGQPEQQVTDINRDVLGKPLSVTRSGQYAGNSVSQTRSYVYDIQQRLCKRIEPETGATLIDYDDAQNLAWSAEGSVLTSQTCDRASVAASEKVVRTYDVRNRLTLVNYPDATADISTGYYPDGAVQWTTTGPVTTNYTYNKRRMLTSEQMVYGSTNWTTSYGYTALGDLATVTYPDLHAVSFAPNALGQATQAGSYATAASYFPNGAVKQFTYGNGLLHTMIQNARQLPETSRDALGTNVVMDDTYDYDYNGNVAGITDALPTNPGNRDMTYDALDRLLITAAGNPQGGYGAFEYDPLDNLRYLDQGPRQNRYTYDATGRLANIKNAAGTLLNTFAYDVRGNTLQRNAGDTFTFDRANRMLTASSGGSSYVYDALGRRVKETTTLGPSMTGSTIYQYSRAGQLLYADDGKTARKHNYIYLSGSLVAKRTLPSAGGAATLTYQHTDALGSLVAASDASAVVVRRERMTPYGEPADGVYDNGHGFTGHQNDAGTRLVYMQQRYYDPAIGRFLGVDPMPASQDSGGNFNRYWYGSNNPYGFIDPDGRFVRRPHERSTESSFNGCSQSNSCRFVLQDSEKNESVPSNVRPALKDTMRRSNPDGDPLDRREQGFYYGVEADGSFGIRLWPAGDMNSISPPGVGSDGTFEGLTVVGEAHSHPHGANDRNPLTGNKFRVGANVYDRAGVRKAKYSGNSYIISRKHVETLDTSGKTIGKTPTAELYGEDPNWWRTE